MTGIRRMCALVKLLLTGHLPLNRRQIINTLRPRGRSRRHSLKDRKHVIFTKWCCKILFSSLITFNIMQRFGIQVGFCFNASCTEAMTLWTSGAADYGILLLGSTTVATDFEQAQVPNGTDGVYLGRNRTLVRVSSNILYCVGLQPRGECGLGDYLPLNVLTKIPLPSASTLTAVALGDEHTALLFDDGSLFTAGCNDEVRAGLVEHDEEVGGQGRVLLVPFLSHLCVVSQATREEDYLS